MELHGRRSEGNDDRAWFFDAFAGVLLHLGEMY